MVENLAAGLLYLLGFGAAGYAIWAIYRNTKDCTTDAKTPRIAYIPHGGEYKFVTNWGAILGALCFVGGLFAGQYMLIVMLVGLATCIGSIYYSARKKRSNWRRVRARCLDKDVFWEYSQDPEGGGKVWTFRLLCAFDLDGKTYRVTPNFWSTFPTKDSVIKFLGNRVSSSGTCVLLINPDNPLETELMRNTRLIPEINRADRAA